MPISTILQLLFLMSFFSRKSIAVRRSRLRFFGVIVSRGWLIESVKRVLTSVKWIWPGPG